MPLSKTCPQFGELNDFSQLLLRSGGKVCKFPFLPTIFLYLRNVQPEAVDSEQWFTN
jgi:hypothetical protein